ncbi:divalent-cation tolerance protein CutA [Parasphingorhabdus sp.]|uniref:divalent-cation tolerance protein CutA n=1 Tax=Parasphingorhabdus sp. TaxID=2709688 RepID=UPI003001D097
MTGSLSLIYSTFGSEEEARDVAKTLLLEKLIACANHFPAILSQYEYQGKFHEDREFPVLFKTAPELVKPAGERLLGLHSFDTPAVLHWQVEASNPGYEKWLLGQLIKPPR